MASPPQTSKQNAKIERERPDILGLKTNRNLHDVLRIFGNLAFETTLFFSAPMLNMAQVVNVHCVGCHYGTVIDLDLLKRFDMFDWGLS